MSKPPDNQSAAPTGPLTLVTGTLAAPVVQRIAAELAPKIDVRVVVLNIQVAALMTTDWVARKLELTADDRHAHVVLPGYCRGDVATVVSVLGVGVTRGPRDVAELAAWLKGESQDDLRTATHDIEIIAEINHVPSLSPETVLDQARLLCHQGADVIDLGCDPDADREAWHGIGDMVKALRDEGMRVSIDSFHPREVREACRAGAELVLSVNQSNVASAADLGVEVVAIPDAPDANDSLEKTIDQLVRNKVPYRIDPILVPIGFGFSASLRRYLDVRDRYPDAAMLMGVGNLTEMTAVDSGGVNAVLIGFCQESSIRSVLTTQVIHWAQASVREIEAARRLMHWAAQQKTVPKHVGVGLVMLRDTSPRVYDAASLEVLAENLTDRNFRIFADTATKMMHVMNRDVHVKGRDPFALFSRMGDVDAAHAFYLGFEMAHALTALQLGKNYTQDEPLDWGLAGEGWVKPTGTAPHTPGRRGEEQR